MPNSETEKKPKSTILLLLAIFFLVYAGLIFRAGINTLFFVTDSSVDYAPIRATVTELQPDRAVQEKEEPRFIPVFSFRYQGKEMIMQAPRLAFNRATDNPPFKTGQEYNLWVHKYQGELILPPESTQQEIGRSQMVISGICLLLTLLLWKLRNWLSSRTDHGKT